MELSRSKVIRIQERREEEASGLKKGDGGGHLQKNPAYRSTVGFVWLQQTMLGDMEQERLSSKSQSPDLLSY